MMRWQSKGQSCIRPSIKRLLSPLVCGIKRVLAAFTLALGYLGPEAVQVAVSTVISVMMRGTAIVFLLALSTPAFAEDVPPPRARPVAEEPKVVEIHELS